MNKFHYVTLCLHSAVHLRAPSISKSSSRLKLDTTIRNWLPVPFKIRSILVMLSKQYFYFVSEPIGCVDIFAAAPRGLRYSALNAYLRSFRRHLQRQSLQCSSLASQTVARTRSSLLSTEEEWSSELRIRATVWLASPSQSGVGMQQNVLIQL